jgi:G:T-mismatch repair DNA endonuclease (very short patch repair protein)
MFEKMKKYVSKVMNISDVDVKELCSIGITPFRVVKRAIPAFHRMIAEGEHVSLYDVAKRVHELGNSCTLARLVLFYGKEDGESRWKSYCDRQAETNSLEYKKKKYGMSDEDFVAYNKSRAASEENLIKRHGEDKGKKMWADLRKRQAYAGVTLEYFVEKFGEIEGEEKFLAINSQKGLTMTNFQRKYGETEGEKKFVEYISKAKSNFSKVSQEMFVEVSKGLCENDNIFYSNLNTEFGKYNNEIKSYYKYDFVVENIKFCVEFNGDIYHANPRTYRPDDVPRFRGNLKTAKEIWDYDRRKISFLESLGFQVIIVWWSDYVNDKEATIRKVLDEISKRRQEVLGRIVGSSRD